ncbi:hypothetical protein C6496_16340 [Candidatus Poribacteria bacterium]|nr:MAG: hypothetical protein C6496_16340 [Candidatus Poribacteria bacterium]
MISEGHWKVLQKTNRMLTLNWETLVKARIEGDQKRIKLAEMSYFQSLRSVLSATQNAVVTERAR